eukprot:COSAG01_NODE_71761_length_255_cov_0.506410_1_plen_55_part_01
MAVEGVWCGCGVGCGGVGEVIPKFCFFFCFFCFLWGGGGGRYEGLGVQTICWAFG